MNALLQLDQQIFFFINQSLRNSFFDLIMPYVRDKDCWIPLYVLIVAYCIYQLRWKSIIVLLLAGITVLLTDQIASSIIKPAVHRLRPCNDPAVLTHVHRLVDCGPGFSFISSHASNHFGIALFLILILRKRFSWVTPVALCWATLICFAQVYVGLHYPLDMMGGALLGAMIGMITGRFCKTSLRKFGVEIA
ncbi:MAG TPA: phosphatase PAP2 family protein [Chitinophagales bacterium]|nr:phosphatase PAP2 family protein [Chitinophagales bacterium]